MLSSAQAILTRRQRWVVEGQELRLSTTYPSPLTDSMCGISISSLASPTLRRELPGDSGIQLADKDCETSRMEVSAGPGHGCPMPAAVIIKSEGLESPSERSRRQGNLKLLMKQPFSQLNLNYFAE